jgi:hypothetical protein
MTTIITRLYQDQSTAETVAGMLARQGLYLTAVDIITRDGAGTPAERMRAATVGADAAAAYAGPVGQGRALLVVNAPFAPMGTALKAIRTVNRTPSIDVGLADEDAYIRDEPDVQLEGRVFTGTVFFMSNPHRRLPEGHILGSDPIRRRPRHNSAISGGAYMSTKFWPMKLISKHRDNRPLTREGWLFSNIFGIPTLVKDWPPREDVPTILT